ncbi:MAG: hypothetical protein N3B18_05920 [Desulfobacterota bacterium]|nr:hypothetical protein [Thermodesulfobacteriota bacterium]
MKIKYALLRGRFPAVLCTVFFFINMFYSQAYSDAAEPTIKQKSYTLLMLLSQSGNPYDEISDALINKLKEYGYETGNNLFIRILASGNDIKEGERILKSELKNEYDVIFVGGTAATISAKNVLYGSKQKVVFGGPTDPIGIGVIKDFESNPEANFTGVCYPVPVKARLRFVKQLMPHVKTLGLIYADMPQSHSYNRWIKELLEKDPEFKDIKVIFQPVPLVTGEEGDKAMAHAAINYIKELDSKVDAFIKPCDQMGTRRHYSAVVYQYATKPLIGITKDDVMDNWGATATMYPSHKSIGVQAARMIKELFEGKPVSAIIPEWPKEFGLAFDLTKAKRFGVTVPIFMLEIAGHNIVK